MRKDLKIGMAIGALLLVVLVVYLAVPKSADTTDVAQDTAQVPEGQPAAEQQGEPAGNEAAPAGTPATVGELASSGSEANAPAAAEPADPFAPGADAADAQASAADAAGTGEGTNWAKLLETGEMPSRTITPTLSASSIVPPAAGNAAPPAGPADAPAAQDAVAETASDVTTDRGTPSGGAASPTTAKAEPDRTSLVVDERPAKRETPGTGNARTHRIAKGETFAKIAETLYGDQRFYLEIEKANPDIDPARLRPGMVINLPDVGAAKRSSGGGSPSSPDDRAMTAGGRQERELDPEKEYKVRPGDSLYVIAKRVYHNSAMSDEIYELNKGAIGDDPARVKVGMVLKLPPKPATEPAAEATSAR
jgi:nucleoid-associated protein YgaU